MKALGIVETEPPLIDVIDKCCPQVSGALIIIIIIIIAYCHFVVNSVWYCGRVPTR